MTIEELLLRMRAVLWNGSFNRWDARAKRAYAFGHGATPREAMEAALRVEVDEADEL